MASVLEQARRIEKRRRVRAGSGGAAAGAAARSSWVRARPLEDTLVRMHDLMIGRLGVSYVSISFPDGFSAARTCRAARRGLEVQERPGDRARAPGDGAVHRRGSALARAREEITEEVRPAPARVLPAGGADGRAGVDGAVPVLRQPRDRHHGRRAGAGRGRAARGAHGRLRGGRAVELRRAAGARWARARWSTRGTG